jgi:hypothetical protein
MSWDYAELSKMAKSVGGPEKLVEMLIDSGKDTGRKEMLPVVGIALGVGALGYAGISKLVNYFTKKKQVSPDAVNAAKAEIIQGIKDYDATHENINNEDEENSETGGEKDE